MCLLEWLTELPTLFELLVSFSSFSIFITITLSPINIKGRLLSISPFGYGVCVCVCARARKHTCTHCCSGVSVSLQPHESVTTCLMYLAVFSVGTHFL